MINPTDDASATVTLEPDDQAVEAERACRLVEALLFAADRPLSDAELAARLPATVEATKVLERLSHLYRFRGINLARVAGGWTFRTAPDLAGLLARETVQPRKLTRAQIETLAIIAYHQPVTRAEVEEIRGVSLAKGTLDLLMGAGWVQPKGRRETPGRPATWVTTDAFLLHFGLESLRDLPNLDELRAAGLLDARAASTMGEAAPDEGGGADLDYPGVEDNPV